MPIDMSLNVCVWCIEYTCMNLLSNGIPLHIFVILQKQKAIEIIFVTFSGLCVRITVISDLNVSHCVHFQDLLLKSAEINISLWNIYIYIYIPLPELIFFHILYLNLSFTMEYHYSQICTQTGTDEKYDFDCWTETWQTWKE